MTFPRPAKAANEEFLPVLKEATFGWSAYEVWRTRIKVQQQKPQDASRAV
jgi:hypothetical protein